MTLRVRLLNIDELRQRVDVWQDEALDQFAESWARNLEQQAGGLLWHSWPRLTGWSSAAFFWRADGDARELHNVAPYAPAVEAGYRFLQAGHPSGMAEATAQDLLTDQLALRAMARTADRFANQGPRGEHRTGLRPHEGTPISVTAGALLAHQYAQLGPYPGDAVLQDFAQRLGQARLSARTTRPRT